MRQMNKTPEEMDQERRKSYMCGGASPTIGDRNRDMDDAYATTFRQMREAGYDYSLSDAMAEAEAENARIAWEREREEQEWCDEYEDLW